MQAGNNIYILLLGLLVVIVCFLVGSKGASQVMSYIKQQNLGGRGGEMNTTVLFPNLKSKCHCCLF